MSTESVPVSASSSLSSNRSRIPSDSLPSLTNTSSVGSAFDSMVDPEASSVPTAASSVSSNNLPSTIASSSSSSSPKPPSTTLLSPTSKDSSLPYHRPFSKWHLDTPTEATSTSSPHDPVERHDPFSSSDRPMATHLLSNRGTVSSNRTPSIPFPSQRVGNRDVPLRSLAARAVSSSIAPASSKHSNPTTLNDTSSTPRTSSSGSPRTLASLPSAQGTHWSHSLPLDASHQHHHPRSVTVGRSAAPPTQTPSFSSHHPPGKLTIRSPRIWPVPYTPEMLELETLLTATLKAERLPISPTSTVFGPTDQTNALQQPSPTGSNTFLSLESTRAPPERVLDLGCGSGSWCLEQAKAWPSSVFVGLDLEESVQLDLTALAELQREVEERLSEDKDLEGESEDVGGLSEEEESMTGREDRVDWRDLKERVEWMKGDFLQPLPFDSGSFDMVHLRFVGLGIPEAKWVDVLEEAIRVLRKGTGILEIVETSYTMPPETVLTPPASPEKTPQARLARLPTALSHPFVNPFTFTPRSASSSSSSNRSILNMTPALPPPVQHIPPPPALPSQRRAYEGFQNKNLLQARPSVVIKPALLMVGGLDQVGCVFSSETLMKLSGGRTNSTTTTTMTDRWVREPREGKRGRVRAPGVLPDVVPVWIDALYPLPHSRSLSPLVASTPARTASLFTSTLAESLPTYGPPQSWLCHSSNSMDPGPNISLSRANANRGGGEGITKMSTSTHPPATRKLDEFQEETDEHDQDDHQEGEEEDSVDGGPVELWAWIGRKKS